MAWLVDDPVVAGPPPAARRRRPSRRLVVLVVIGLAVVLAGAALWALLPGATAIAHTEVLLDAKPFACSTPSDVTTFDSEDGFDAGTRVVVPAIRMHPGLSCTMTVVIRNDGDADVAVDSVTIPLAGPVNGIGIRADEAVPQGFAPTGGADSNDAVFDYAGGGRYSGGPVPVAARSVQRLAFHLSWKDGCMGTGSADTFTDAPAVVLSAGPWHLEKRGSGAGYAFLGGKHTFSAVCGH